MGRNGKITVNGKEYNATMVPMNYLNDEQIANVLTYVRNSFGNSGDAVSVEEVTRVRQQVVPPPAQSNFE
jgi:nitrite reductase (NO-forming)